MTLRLQRAWKSHARYKVAKMILVARKRRRDNPYKDLTTIRLITNRCLKYNLFNKMKIN